MKRQWVVVGVACLAIGAFILASFFANTSKQKVAESTPVNTVLERSYSPSLGPRDAPVTIVEFFDPACEACRRFHPIVKGVLAKHPKKVRLVLRYTPFHKGSKEAVRILEVARAQNKFEDVLEALLATQPQWASHSRPNISIAWDAAAKAGLDMTAAKYQSQNPEILAVINQDQDDVKAAKVRGTPTFFVNGKRLVEFGSQQFLDLVASELKATTSGS